MTTLATDTSLDAERVQIALFRQASPARRFALARSLSRSTLQMARRAIRQRHPEATEDEISLIFVAHHYGPELATRLEADLIRRRQ